LDVRDSFGLGLTMGMEERETSPEQVPLRGVRQQQEEGSLQTGDLALVMVISSPSRLDGGRTV
jgi:hypothetical protein